MERANWTFEEQWSQALGEAEVPVPGQVWVAIDGQLANEQAAGYKKQADFYKWVAAACLLLFGLGGTFYWFSGSGSSDVEIVKSESQLDTKGKISDKNTPMEMAVLDDIEEETTEATNESSVNEEVEKLSIGVAPTKTLAIVNNSTSTTDLVGLNEERIIGRDQELGQEWIMFTSKPTSLATNLTPWKTDQLYGVPNTWEVIAKEKSTSPLWAGVSFSTGSFDPGFGSSQDDFVFASQEGFVMDAMVSQVPPQQSPSYSSGQSVAGGVNLGKRLHKRLVLSSGLHYSAFNTGSVSSQVVADAHNNNYALTAETSDRNLETALSEGNLRYAGEEVQLVNEYQYLTVPLKAGYVLLDKKFNITLNTGLSSNFLIDSKLASTGEGQALNNDFSTSQNYESVYFNFLTSVEFGYLFKQHYQFLFEPNYNQALTDFTSSNHSDAAKPKNIGLTVGFRYNF